MRAVGGAALACLVAAAGAGAEKGPPPVRRFTFEDVGAAPGMRTVCLRAAGRGAEGRACFDVYHLPNLVNPDKDYFFWKFRGSGRAEAGGEIVGLEAAVVSRDAEPIDWSPGASIPLADTTRLSAAATVGDRTRGDPDQPGFRWAAVVDGYDYRALAGKIDPLIDHDRFVVGWTGGPGVRCCDDAEVAGAAVWARLVASSSRRGPATLDTRVLESEPRFDVAPMPATLVLEIRYR